MEYRKADDADIQESRRQLVSKMQDRVKADLKHWEYAFKRMREWRQFVRGMQWPGTSKASLSDADREYVVNITLRHLKQRTASIYAKNPSYVYRRSQQLHAQVWDGTAQQLVAAKMAVEAGLDVDGSQAGILMDAQAAQQRMASLARVGETLTILYGYFMREQMPPAKRMMKKQVVSALTCGVAYFKQTFQRAMEPSPDVDRAIRDHQSRLMEMERLAADLAEGEIDENSAEMERLRVMLADLEAQPQLIVREGLAIDYPDSVNIIPDRNMTFLPGFVGCGHVTEQYILTPEQVKAVYGVDLGSQYTEYHDLDSQPVSQNASRENQRITARVWEIWDRNDNMVYTVAEGYPDFLEEPHSPITYTERFWPWFVFAPNAIDCPEDPFPPSDVELIQGPQMEINRAGEALREHRYAARPGHVTSAAIDGSDSAALAKRKAHDVIPLKGLMPDQSIDDVLQAFPTSPIDMNLYQTQTAFADVLRSVGTQEANLGGTTGATATETSVAESSRQSTLESSVDEFDDLLTEMARAGGQILLQEMTPEQVGEIVGPGAAWPETSGDEVAKEVFLEAEAGSSGRPNQAQQVAVLERIFPLLFQLPSVSHEKMAKHALRVLDDRATYEDWLDTAAMPVAAMNGQMQADANRGPGPGEGDNGQGGGDNAPAPPEEGPQGMPSPGQDGFGNGGMAL